MNSLGREDVGKVFPCAEGFCKYKKLPMNPRNIYYTQIYHYTQTADGMWSLLKLLNNHHNSVCRCCSNWFQMLQTDGKYFWHNEPPPMCNDRKRKRHEKSSREWRRARATVDTEGWLPGMIGIGIGEEGDMAMRRTGSMQSDWETTEWLCRWGRGRRVADSAWMKCNWALEWTEG